MNIDLNELGNDQQNKKMLTIALGKGRGFEESLGLIKTSVKSEAYQAFAKGILPVYVDEKNNVRLVKIRNKDLPGLLAKEYIDVAIGSSVWFDEFSAVEATCLMPLPLLKCRLSVIAEKKIPVEEITSICSKFQSITNQYIAKNNLKANLLVMEGCHEVALSLGMSDVIIDIIETGSTIKRMNFVEVECIRQVTHGIWTRIKDAENIEKLIIQKMLQVETNGSV